MPCRRLLHRHRDALQGQAAWEARQTAKANLARPLDIDNVADATEKRLKTPSDTETTLGAAELTQLIDENLPVTLRADYLAMLAGKPVMKARRKVIQAAVLRVFHDHNIVLDDYGWDAFPEADVEPSELPKGKTTKMTPVEMARLNGLPEDDDQGEEDDDSAADG